MNLRTNLRCKGGAPDDIENRSQSADTGAVESRARVVSVGSCAGDTENAPLHQAHPHRQSVVSLLTVLWIFLMTAVFPYYMKNHYSQMGVRKFSFFLTVSLICLIPAGVLAAGRLLCLIPAGSRGRLCAAKWFQRTRKPQTRANVQAQRLSSLDIAMLCYLVAIFFSWLFSVDRAAGWTGTDGWSMGLRTQALLVLMYFLVSRYLIWWKGLLAIHMLASGGVFLLGILHRFSIDPLGMYQGIDEKWQLLFLSTIGQASWYSGYVCVALTAGIAVFFIARNSRIRTAAGLYCMLGFGTVVTQNSDSAFAAMAFLFLGLFLVACDNFDRMERFLETLLLMFGSFKAIGILQEIFPAKAKQLGRLSEFFSKSTATWVFFLIVCMVYIVLLLYRQKHENAEIIRCGRILRRVAVMGTVGLIFIVAAVIWANTTGLLQRWFGVSSTSEYLLFNQSWGNSRGFSWSLTAETFGKLPFWRKLTGVGPDCYSVYCYADAELAGRLHHYFGQDQMLTNAHNEFLNQLFCTGVIGLAAFIGFLAAAVQRFWKNREKAPMALMGMLAALVYCAHNFFCYQQICCIPFLFLLIAMSENLVREAAEG